MKMLLMLGALALTGVSASASAERVVRRTVVTRTVVNNHSVRHNRGRQVCTTRWKQHRRVRTCRWR